MIINADSNNNIGPLAKGPNGVEALRAKEQTDKSVSGGKIVASHQGGSNPATNSAQTQRGFLATQGFGALEAGVYNLTDPALIEVIDSVLDKAENRSHFDPHTVSIPLDMAHHYGLVGTLGDQLLGFFGPDDKITRAVQQAENPVIYTFNDDVGKSDAE